MHQNLTKGKGKKKKSKSLLRTERTIRSLLRGCKYYFGASDIVFTLT